MDLSAVRLGVSVVVFIVPLSFAPPVSAQSRTNIRHNGFCLPVVVALADGINERAAELAARRGVVAGRITDLRCNGNDFGGVIRQPSGRHVPFSGEDGSEGIFRKMQGD